MDISDLIKVSEYEWQIPKTGAMRVPGVVYADETLIK
jgi:tRNA-splicing ligase RtcB (3'-phosphate/5'-hydroxy nucleic acid ligase)